MREPILKVVNLSKRFGGVKAVDGVSFELEEGGSLGIIGPNGSGKTTLANLITGFVKPDSGEVFFKGRRITGLMPYQIANMGIARTFQRVRPIHSLPAYKNLIIPLYSPRVKRLRGGKYGDRDEVALDLLEEVGFERDSSTPYKVASALPHGYLKRLELARCLALRPSLIIMDELLSGMSMSEVASILHTIEKMKEWGITLLMIEHRVRELLRIVDRILVLDHGRKIAEGSPQEIVNNEEVKKAYLGAEVV
jgi:ABC-type branched-subunit amino acid transport system ATPase component